MEEIIKIQTGDPGGDGHGRSNTWYFKVNYPIQSLKDAYNKSVEVTGIDLKRECNEYQKAQMSDDCIKSLHKNGVEVLDFFEMDWDDKKSVQEIIESEDFEKYMEIEDFVMLIMKFISISMPEDFVYSQHNNNIQSLGTFGYGFYD
jgi:hypothetical protein